MNYEPDYVLFLDFLEADLGDVDRADRGGQIFGDRLRTGGYQIVGDGTFGGGQRLLTGASSPPPHAHSATNGRAGSRPEMSRSHFRLGSC